VQAVPADASTDRAWPWVTSPAADLLNAFAWLPVVGVLAVLHDDALRDAAAVILLLSLVHQALTPLLLVSDASTSRRHPFIYAAGAPAVLLGSWLLVTYAGLGWVAVVAAGWNVVHTLRQRYGILRQYGRGVGQDRRPIEQGLVFGPFLLAAGLVVWLPGRLDHVRATMPEGRINSLIVSGLSDARVVAPGVVAGGLALTILAVRDRLRTSIGRPVSYPKRVYLAAYWLALAVAVVDPVRGLLALVAAHSFEYVFALDATLGRRFAAPGSTAHSLIVKLGGRRRLLVAAAVGCAFTILALRAGLPEGAYLLAYMTIGGSHFLFDGFMWRTNAPVSNPWVIRWRERRPARLTR
jgi:hypothetical protein